MPACQIPGPDQNGQRFLRAARRAGLCVSIGGDTYCYGRPEMLLAVNARLRAQGTPTALWGCSVEPELLRGEILDDMRGYRTIVCRESITFQAMRAAGLPVGVNSVTLAASALLGAPGAALSAALSFL